MSHTRTFRHLRVDSYLEPPKNMGMVPMPNGLSCFLLLHASIFPLFFSHFRELIDELQAKVQLYFTLIPPTGVHAVTFFSLRCSVFIILICCLFCCGWECLTPDSYLNRALYTPYSLPNGWLPTTTKKLLLYMLLVVNVFVIVIFHLLLCYVMLCYSHA